MVLERAEYLPSDTMVEVIAARVAARRRTERRFHLAENRGETARATGEEDLTVLAFLISLFAITTDAWLQDFRQLMNEISTHYANLDSAIADRRLDLVDLRRRTEESLRNAKSDEEARQALDRFMREFGDGHASVQWSTRRPSADDASKPLCERLRYRARDMSGIDFAQLGNFERIEDDAGILTLDKKRRVGVIRIALFSGGVYPELCKEVQTTLGLADDAPCDFDCEIRIGRAVDDRMTASLERTLATLQKGGATAILVDVTGNGGGSDWVEPAARVLTPVPLKSPRLGFIKHPHWVKILEEELADVEHDIASDLEPKRVLRDARETLQRALERAKEPCDRSGVREGKKPGCSLIVTGMLYASGVLAHARRDVLPSGRATNVLFNPAQFTYREGVNRLPLYVLTDGRTASAAELFAAMLKDNGAATLIGTPTNGAGCGHMNGGVWATLENSQGRVQLPDCSRFRSDGTNEVLGITPDVLVPWRSQDSRYQRARKTLQVLERILR